MNNQLDDQLKITKVLLLCIFNKYGQQQLTHDNIYRLFSQFGIVNKILIFEKIKTFKAFIELETKDQAMRAKLFLHDMIMYEDGTKLEVHFSKLKSVQFQNQNSGGIDYKQLYQQQQNFLIQQNLYPLQQTLQIQYQQHFQQFYDAQNRWIQSNEQLEGIDQKQQPNDNLLENYSLLLNNNQQLNLHNYQNEDQNLQESTELIDQNQQIKQQIQDDIKQQQKLLQQFTINEDIMQSQYEKQSINNQNNSNLMNFNKLYEQQNKSVSSKNEQLKKTFSINSDKSVKFQKISDDKSQSSQEMMESLQKLDSIIQKTQQNQSFHSQSTRSSIQLPSNPSQLHQRNSLQHDGIQPLDNYKKRLSDSNDMVQRFQKISVSSQDNLCTNNYLPLMKIIIQPCDTDSSSDSENEGKDQTQLNQKLLQIKDLEIIPSQAQNMDNNLRNISLQQNKFLNEPNQQFNMEDLMKNAQTLNSLTMIENHQSRVLYVRGITHPSIQAENLFNIFRNFGEVQKIILMKNKQIGFVQYAELHQAQKAKEHLNNLNLIEDKLKVFYSKYNQFELNFDNKQYSCDIFVPSQNDIKQNQLLIINPPSNTLHVSNIKKDAFQENEIRQLFQQFGTVEAIKLLQSDGFKFMCQIKFKNIDDSVKALTFLHNIDFYGRKIQISFTKQKI